MSRICYKVTTEKQVCKGNISIRDIACFLRSEKALGRKRRSLPILPNAIDMILSGIDDDIISVDITDKRGK